MSTVSRWNRLYKQEKHLLKWPSEHVVRWAAQIDGKGKRALDIGCGAGRHLGVLWDTGAEVWGIDSSAAVVAYCEKEYVMPGIEIAVADMNNISHPDESFDFALAYGVFYYGTTAVHIGAIRELHRVLRTDGEAFVVVRTNRDTRRTMETLQEEVKQGAEAGMTLNFLEEKDIIPLYGGFSSVSWELTETTRYGRQWLDSDWLISLIK